MSRSGQLLKLAGEWENANHVRNHAEYRKYLENMRRLWLDVSLMMSEDARQLGDWLYKRPSSMRWWDRLFLSARVRGNGKNVAESMLEAAQTAVRLAAVHAEYMAMEGATTQTSGRYRTAS